MCRVDAYASCRVQMNDTWNSRFDSYSINGMYVSCINNKKNSMIQDPPAPCASRAENRNSK